LTARIVDYMAELIKQRHQWDIRQDEDGKALGSLRVACEYAKKALSDQEETLVQVDLDGIGAGAGSFSELLTRAKLEELNQDLLDRAMALVDGALTRSGRRQPDMVVVDEIVLAGGSARIPKLRQLVQDYMGGREPNSRKGVEAQEAIIHGRS
jgi:heat shock protein 5